MQRKNKYLTSVILAFTTIQLKYTLHECYISVLLFQLDSSLLLTSYGIEPRGAFPARDILILSHA